MHERSHDAAVLPSRDGSLESGTMKQPAIYPKHPERICWGCEKYCPANHLNCRETRVEHPVEMFGEDWQEWPTGNTQAPYQGKASPRW